MVAIQTMIFIGLAVLIIIALTGTAIITSKLSEGAIPFILLFVVLYFIFMKKR